MATTRKSVEKVSIVQKIRGIVFSSQGFPIFLSFTTLAILFVLFRMKNIEMDYQIAETNKEIEKVVLDNKELKAKKAKMLSADKLRNLASIHKLDQPKQDQIIVVP